MDAAKSITEGFEKNTAVYSIVMKFASKFGSIPRYVYDAKKTEQKSINKNETLDDKNPLVKLINRPNPYESQDAFFTKLCAYWKTTGEAMIFLNRGDISQYLNSNNVYDSAADKVIDTMPVLEMYVLPSDKVNPVPDPDDIFGCLGWVLDYGAGKMPIRKNDLIHWKMPNLKFDTLSSQLRGFSPLEAGARTLTQNNTMTDAAVRMAQNDGARGVMINKTLGASQNPIQQAQVKKTFDEKINSPEVKGQVAALQGDWVYENFGQTAVDMQLLEAKNMSWQELCFLLSVPYELFDSKTTYANKEQAQKGWVSNDIIPACKQLDGELNRSLLKAFKMEGTAFIASDTSDLPEMQKDMAQLATALNQAWWLTPNEKREIMSEESMPDATLDEIWPPSTVSPLSESGMDAQLQQTQMQIDAFRNGNAQSSANGQVRAGNNGKVPAKA